MAAITFGAARQADGRLRLAAAQVKYARQRDREINVPMIAVQMMSRNPLLGRPKRSAAVVEHQPERTGIATAGGAAADLRHFNRSIPVL